MVEPVTVPLVLDVAETESVVLAGAAVVAAATDTVVPAGAAVVAVPTTS